MSERINEGRWYRNKRHRYAHDAAILWQKLPRSEGNKASQNPHLVCRSNQLATRFGRDTGHEGNDRNGTSDTSPTGIQNTKENTK